MSEVSRQAAATKIQARFRGNKVRKDDVEKALAATKIQSAQRGKLGRQEAAAIREKKNRKINESDNELKGFY